MRQGVAATPTSEMKIDVGARRPIAVRSPLSAIPLLGAPGCPQPWRPPRTSKWKKEVAEFRRVRSLLHFGSSIVPGDCRGAKNKERERKREGGRERGAHHVEGARGERERYSGCALVNDDSLVVRYVKTNRTVSPDFSFFYCASILVSMSIDVEFLNEHKRLFRFQWSILHFLDYHLLFSGRFET